MASEVVTETNVGGTMKFFTKATGGTYATAPLERMRINSSGNVGIGTTSPSSKLELGPNGSLGANITNKNVILNVDGGYGTTGTPTSGQYKVIGFTGTTKDVTDITGQNGGETSKSFYAGIIGGDYFNQNRFSIWQAGVERLTILGTATGSGNVGIGTANPDFRLDVKKDYASGYGKAAKFRSGNDSTFVNFDTVQVAQTDVPCLSIIETSTGTQADEQKLTFAVGDARAVIGLSSTVTDGLSFYTSRAVTAAGYIYTGILALHLENDGKVGVGTSQPIHPLYVAGDIGQTDGSRIWFRGSSSSSGTGAQSYVYSNGLNLQIKGDDNVQILGDSGGIIAHFDYTGNVGIGTTSPGAKLDVAGSINTSGSINLTNAGLNTIAASNPSNGYLRFLVDQQGVALTLNADTNSTFGGIIYAVDGNKATPGYSFASDPDTGMFRDSANVLVLGVNADTRIRITNSDIVTYKPLGINTTSITSGVALDVDGVALIKDSTGVGDLYLGNYATANHFRFHTNNSNTYFDMNCGDIYWRQGTSTRYQFFASTANMTIQGTLTQNSDARTKENVIEISDCISKVKAMRGVYYNRTDFNTEVTKVGVIAQEVEAVLPELVLESPETGLKSVAYSELTSVLINAIKEQQEIIEDLKTRITKLEN